MQTKEHPKIKAWLDECRAATTKRSYSARITRFFKWYNKPVDEFLSLPQEEKRHIALQFQNQPNLRANTACAILAALNSFLDTYELKINFKGKIRRREMDLDSHNFSNGDLSKMFKIANNKEKAVLALGTSLGWEVSAVLGLPRKQLQSYVDRAKSEGKQFYYFLSQRSKTGVPRLGVLNPLALEWAEKWLMESENTPLRKRKVDRFTQARVVSDLFDITEEGANKILRRLASEAHIIKTGRIHFHKLRSWVMSGLSRAGFNEFQIKFVVGKAIPSCDLTYLHTLQLEISEKYPKAYEDYLNLETPVRAVVDLSKSLEEKTGEIEILRQQISELRIRNDSSEQRLRNFEKFMGKFDEFVNNQQSVFDKAKNNAET